jgi:hypothetical protein
MAKTWDTSRTGGGTYEFSQDAQGRYTLNSVGFKGINKLDLPELKTGAAATTAADTSKKDIAALSAQTTQAFGDVAPFYYDKDKDEASKYIRRKEDKDKDETIAPITYAEAKKRMTQDEAYTRPEYSTTRPSGIDTPMKKPLPEWTKDADTRGWSTDVMTAKPKEVTQVSRQNVDEILAKRAEADKIKKVERFPPGQQFGPQKTSPYQDAIMRGETGVKEGTKPVDKGFIQKIIPQKVKDTYQYAMQKINTGTKFLRTAVGIVGGPFVSGATMLMGAVKETPQNKHDKQYFNADNTGRIVTINPTTGKQENASTSLYAGMNRVSLRGNLEKAGAKRIATREKAIAKGNVSQKFINDTNNMKKEQNDYKDSSENVVDEGYTRTREERKDNPGRQDREGGGADDNSSSGCVVATHAVNAGVFDLSTKRQAIRWCVKNLHRTWWGEAIRRGYKYYGQKAINQGTVKKHYQEFKNYLAFATGKKRNLKNTWTFLYRTIQFFIKGITI